MALATSSQVESVHCAPGNAGTSELATNHPVAASDVSALVDLATSLDASLVVVGPEAPLCDALADRLAASGIPCFGPVQALAELEGSKLHAKQVMRTAGVPTAAFHVLDSTSDVDAALDEFFGPAVGRKAAMCWPGAKVWSSPVIAVKQKRSLMPSSTFGW